MKDGATIQTWYPKGSKTAEDSVKLNYDAATTTLTKIQGKIDHLKNRKNKDWAAVGEMARVARMLNEILGEE